MLCLRASDFYVIVDKILTIFPNECRDTYFIPCSKKGRHSLGCLPNKYRSIKRILSRNNLNEDNSSQENLGEVNEVNEEFLEKQNWLKSNSDETAVTNVWKETSIVRTKLLQQTHCKDISQLLEEWPAFKYTYGNCLISIDFGNLYPGKADNLIKDWDAVANKLISYMTETFTDYYSKLLLDSLSSAENDLRNLIVFKLLHKIIPPAASSIPNNKKWHPSIADSQDAFILHILDPINMADEIKEKKRKLESYGMKLQPFIIVTGAASNLSSILIFFDDMFYKANSVLEAVDHIFKLFQVLNLKYPTACAQVWLFIQQGIFKIFTPYDGHQKLPKVSTVINDLQL